MRLRECKLHEEASLRCSGVTLKLNPPYPPPHYNMLTNSSIWKRTVGGRTVTSANNFLHDYGTECLILIEKSAVRLCIAASLTKTLKPRLLLLYQAGERQICSVDFLCNYKYKSAVQKKQNFARTKRTTLHLLVMFVSGVMALVQKCIITVSEQGFTPASCPQGRHLDWQKYICLQEASAVCVNTCFKRIIF